MSRMYVILSSYVVSNPVCEYGTMSDGKITDII